MIKLSLYHSKLYTLKDLYCTVHFKKSTYFKSCIIASFSKSVELGFSLFKENDEEDAYFKTASLRGVCEEIIVLLYIQKMLHPKQNDVISHLLAMGIVKDLKSQEEFFKINRPKQPILDTRIYSDKKSAQDALRLILSQKGINGDKLPPVEQMAQKVNLSELYAYMYRATSNFVHFNPGHLMRMGWGKNMSEATFSASNFYKYYSNFNRFYISYLLVVFCKVFKTELKLKGEIWKVIKSMENELNKYLTWPEIVTFEEMNLRRPSEIFTLFSESMERIKSK